MASPPFKVKLTKVPQLELSSKALEMPPNSVSGFCMRLDSAEPNPLLLKELGGGGLLKLVQPDSGREVLMAVQPFVKCDDRLRPASEISQEEFSQLQDLAGKVTDEQFTAGKANAEVMQEAAGRQLKMYVNRPNRRINYSNVASTSSRLPFLVLPASHINQFQSLNFTPMSEILQRLRHTHQVAAARPQLLTILRPGPPPPTVRRPDILEQLESFANTFRRRRLELGFSQYDFSSSMKKLYDAVVSQTTVSRFEALNLSIRNMRRLRPALQRWVEDVGRAAREEAQGGSAVESADKEVVRRVELRASGREQRLTVCVFAGEPAWVELRRERRRRTKLSGEAQATLTAAFEKTPMPNNDKISVLASQLDLSRNVVKAWFCNRRLRVRRMRNLQASEHRATGILNLAPNEIGLVGARSFQAGVPI